VPWSLVPGDALESGVCRKPHLLITAVKGFA
jgi:hypothetical protein